MTDDLPDYPEGAGYRHGSDASMDGARAINPKRETLCLAHYQRIFETGARGLTADEIAAEISVEAYLIRPRLTDLQKAGSIVKSGERRMGAHGVANTVWIAKTFAPPPPEMPPGPLFDQAPA